MHPLRIVRINDDDLTINFETKAHLETFEGNPKEDDTLKAILNQRPEETLKPIDTPSALSGKTDNFYTGVRVISDEDGIHQHRFGELPFSLPCPRERVLVATLQNGAWSLLS